MRPLLLLIATLTGDAVRRAGQRVARASALFILAMMFLGIGVTGLSLAVFLLLARFIDPILAALLLGSLFCLSGAVLLLMARMQTRPQSLFLPTPEQERARQDLTALLQKAGAPVVLVPALLAVVMGYVLTTRKK